MIGAFFRLAFVTACAGLVFGLILLADYTTNAVAVIVGLVGTALAVVLSEDWSQGPEATPRRRRHRPWRRTAPYEGES